MYHRLTTSFPSFGPVVSDGYGLCYNVKDTDIMAGVTSFKNQSGTCADTLAAALQQSLLDIQALLTPAAKL